MSFRLSARALRAAYVVALCLPAAALAQTAGLGRPPVGIVSCDFQYTRPRMIDFVRAVDIGFVNNTATTAAAVRIKWSYTTKAGKTVGGFVNDAGSFAGGAQVRHTFTLDIDPNDQAGRQNAVCSVVGVRFADGTAWRPGMRGIVTPPPPTPTPTPTPEPPTP